MTRKDFELIADALVDSFHKSGITIQQHKIIAGAMANRLATTNDNFNRSLFMYAAGARED